MSFKYLIMCEGPNELEIIKILLENNKMIFSYDDLLNLTPYHARQIQGSSVVKNALNMYSGDIKVLRIGDKLSDKLKIPPDYKKQIIEVSKYCTKPELELLLIISENLENEFIKLKSSTSPKVFSKQNIVYNRKRYDNSTKFFREYYGTKVDLLVESIKKYRQLNGKHNKDEGYLVDLLK